MPSRIGAIDCKFLKFVLVDQTVVLDLRQGRGETTKAVLSVAGQSVTVLTVRWSEQKPQSDPIPVATLSDLELGTAPFDNDLLRLKVDSGWIAPPMPASAREVTEHFPALANAISPSSLMAAALTSTLVGMVAPGLHSIFSECALDFVRNDVGREGLGFQVDMVDQRFHVLNASLIGPGLAGHLAAFLRGKPVEPPSMAAAAKLVEPTVFAGQRALVVGGSRGIGAASATLLAAGGANVILTYQRGRAEAERITADIVRYGGDASALELDVLRESTAWVAACGDVTHLYFFATPKIFRQSSILFQEQVFDEFSSIYLKGFAKVLTALYRPGTHLSVLYPSSVAIETRPKGMTEYAMVKAAGEELCKDFNRQWPDIRFSMPRLPRIHTDQTATVPPSPAEDALSTILPILQTLAREHRS